MKKGFFIFPAIILSVCVFGFTGCSMGTTVENDFTEVIERENIPSTLITGTTIESIDTRYGSAVLKVTP